NIAPILIESNIKACLPVVSNVIAIGDLRKFVSVFLTLKVTRDSDGAPTTRLTKGAQEWCTANGSNAKEIMEIIRDSPSGIMRAIQRGIDEANEKAISNAAKGVKQRSWRDRTYSKAEKECF
ncbi:AcylCoA synthetase bubblegum family member 2, partial [Caligus rogercresseyi]